MANYFDDWVVSPLETMWRDIRAFIDVMATWAFALWFDHRPPHTMVWANAHPTIYVVQRSRTSAFLERQLARLSSARVAFLSPRWAM